MSSLLDTNPDEDLEASPEEDTSNGAAQDLRNSEENTGFYKKSGSKSSKSSSSKDLAESETTSSSGESFYRSAGRKVGGIREGAKTRIKAIAKNKWAMGGAVGGLGSVAAVLVLVIIAGSLKLPNVMSQIEAYQFANVTSDFANSSSKATEEALAVDATTSSTWQSLKEKFATNLSNIRESTWGRLDAYRPSKIIQNLNESGGLEINYKTNLFGGKQWTGGVLDGNTYSVQEVTGISKWVPGLNNVLKSRNAAVTRDQLISDIMQREEVSTLGVITKGRVFLNLLDATDGSLTGWLLNRFTGNKGQPMTDQEALDAASLEEEQATANGLATADNAVTSGVVKAEEAYKNQLAQDTSTQQGVTAIVNNGGEDAAANAAAGNAISTMLGGPLNTALGVVDPLYAIFVPICIIYDGSVQQSGPMIANNINQQIDSFDQLAAEADQQKRGNLSNSDATALANAVRGTNAELGNITNSIPYKRASGQSFSTSGVQSVEAGSNGAYYYSLINAIGISGAAASFINKVVQPVCRVMTDPRVAIGVGVLNIAAAFVTFGQSEAYEQAAEQGAKSVVTAFSKYLVDQILSAEDKNIGEQLTTKVVVDNGGTLSRGIRALRLVGSDTGKKIVQITGLTLLANMVVSSRAGQAANGFAQGQTLINQADSGANIEANEVERTQLFGRPLMPSEVNNEVQNATNLIAKENASKSFYSRYFAMDNPASLLSRFATGLGNFLHPKVIMADLLRLFSDLLHPLSLFGSISSLLGTGTAHAATEPPLLTYGNIQFGWTNTEKALINSNDSYFPLENNKILKDSGLETKIVQTYANCFGYTYNPNGNGDFAPTDPNGDLTPAMANMDPGSLATLITSGDIPRDSSGNVLYSGGLCSPQNLGVNNPTFGDLVFRWRLAMNYDTTLDTLNNMQTVN